jgi:hypothetical protein
MGAQQSGHYKKGGAKDRRKGKGLKKDSKFQVALSGHFQDYSPEEDAILKRAWMVGNPNVKYNLRGQNYIYDFEKMLQINKETGKGRPIRKPHKFPDMPTSSLLPTGPMVVISVKKGQPGTCIQVPDINNPGQFVPVYVPPGAKVGSKMAVPMPAKGQTVAQVQDKQKKYDEQKKKSGQWSTGGKVAATGAALVGVGAVGVGGVILGDHLAGGDMAGDLVDAAVDVGEAIGDVGEDAIDAIGDFGEDAIDWFGDAGEDVGDFIMDLF